MHDKETRDETDGTFPTLLVTSPTTQEIIQQLILAAYEPVKNSDLIKSEGKSLSRQNQATEAYTQPTEFSPHMNTPCL
jgi:hypothetical protein